MMFTKEHLLGALSVIVISAAAFDASADDSRLRQDLGRGDHVVITSADEALPEVLVQATPRRRPYGDDLMDVGFYVRTGGEITLPTDIRMQNLNTSHIIGAHGEGTVVRYTGRWQADGGNAFPHLVLTDGGRFVFTQKSSMDLVMDGSFFTRQLWVYGDGTGVVELEEGFVADRTVNEPLPDAMGTIRLGGATLITHHSRNMPANTRPDGRGGNYANGHVVFERVDGNRWIVDTSNQVYDAQVDFDTDGVIETRASLTHNGHLRVVLPVGPGGHFKSSGAFRTTSPDVTITKTGPAMLALEGEQSYHPGSRLVVEEGLLRMTTDPGLGRDPDARGAAGPYLRLQVRNDAKLHLTAPLHRMKQVGIEDTAQAWLDPDCVLQTSDGTTVGEDAELHLQGTVTGPLSVSGTLHLDPARGRARVETLEMNGRVRVAVGNSADDAPLLEVSGSAVLTGELQISFTGRGGNVPQRVVLVEADDLRVRGDAFTGRRNCADERFSYNIGRNSDQLVITDIRPMAE